jgi:GntR family transcriptional regulator
MADPMYRKIAEDLRTQIESGALQPGQKLRTEIELRDHYDASRNTVRDAIKWLTSLGLVETRPGQGTFVVQKIQPYITTLTADPEKTAGGDIADIIGLYGEISSDDTSPEKKREFSKSDPQVEIQKANSEIASQLQVGEGAQVISRHERRYIDETPWSLQTSFYPMGFVLKGADRLIQADDITTGAVKYLGETLGLRQVSYRDWIKVRTPDTTEAKFFDLPQDGRVAVFEIFRTAFDQTGAPLRLTVTVFPTDRNQFIINVGDVPSSAPAVDGT